MNPVCLSVCLFVCRDRIHHATLHDTTPHHTTLFQTQNGKSNTIQWQRKRFKKEFTKSKKRTQDCRYKGGKNEMGWDAWIIFVPTGAVKKRFHFTWITTCNCWGPPDTWDGKEIRSERYFAWESVYKRPMRLTESITRKQWEWQGF